MTSIRWQTLAIFVGMTLIGGLLGAPFGRGSAFLTAVAGTVFAWSIVKGVVLPAIRGAVTGALFLSIAGPLADMVISGATFDEVREKLAQAAVIGFLVGATLGTRNARRPKPTFPESPTDGTTPASSQPSIQGEGAPIESTNEA